MQAAAITRNRCTKVKFTLDTRRESRTRLDIQFPIAAAGFFGLNPRRRGDRALLRSSGVIAIATNSSSIVYPGIVKRTTFLSPETSLQSECKQLLQVTSTFLFVVVARLPHTISRARALAVVRASSAMKQAALRTMCLHGGRSCAVLQFLRS